MLHSHDASAELRDFSETCCPKETLSALKPCRPCAARHRRLVLGGGFGGGHRAVKGVLGGV